MFIDMNKRQVLFLLSLVSLLFFASCQKEDYKSVIPQDANMVASLNVGELIEEADLSHSAILKQAKEWMGLVATGSMRRKMDALLEEPNKLGFDFREPAYLFQTPNHCYGLALKVADDSDLEDTFSFLRMLQICSKLTEKDGKKWGMLLGEINFAFDANTFLLMVPTKGDNPSAVKSLMTHLLSLDENQQFQQSENYAKLTDTKGVIRFFSKANALPEAAEKYMSTMLPQNVRFGDVQLSSSVHFDKGAIRLVSTIFSDNPAVQQLIDEADENMHTISGKYLNAPADGFFVWSTLGCNGDWLLNTLKRNETMKNWLRALERAVDIEKMLKAVDGDVTFVMNSAEAVSGGDMNFLAMAEIENHDFLNDVGEWKQSMRDYNISMQEVGRNQYQLSAADYRLNWGVEDQNLYFTTDKSFVNNALGTKSNTLQSYSDEIHRSKMFTYISLDAFSNTRSSLSGKSADYLLNKIQGIVMKSDKMGDFEIRIQGRDLSKSLLKSLLEFD